MEFERFAPWYDRFMRGTGLERTALLLEAFGPTGMEKVVDLGGGTGVLARALRPRVEEVWLVEQSPRMASRLRDPGVHLKLGSALATGFEPASFDAAFLSDVLHHVPDQAGLLREVQRILKPGGRLIIQDFDAASFRGRLYAFLEGFCFRVHYRSKASFGDLARAHGFRLLREPVGGSYFIQVWEKRAMDQ